ncbi:MAG: glycosyltransferase [Solirubrobacteraceae bacterium]
MNVLYLTAEVPYPLTSGYLRHFHFLRGLGAGHAIVHLSLTRRAVVEPEARRALAAHVERLEVFGAGQAPQRTRLRRSAARRRAAHELRRAVASHLSRGDTDVVLLSGKDTFPALRAIGDVPLVIDVCDAASVRLRGELAVAPPRRRGTLALRLAEIERVERHLVACTPHLLFASERDRAAVGAEHGLVVPNGVDVGHWTPSAAPVADPVVAFSGSMSYPPNHDAALRLVEAVMPRVRRRVPAVRAVVAGRGPLPPLRAAADRAGGVTLTGACDDLRPHLRSAAVYCAPLRFASGIQNKLLEALAMALPVVTTEVAAAGLRIDGEDPPLVVADDDDAIAGAVAALLADPGERAPLGAAGRAFVERRFSWARSIAQLEAALYEAAGGPAPSRQVLGGRV